jgi:phosphoadenosine phosphosulfate reductase
LSRSVSLHPLDAAYQDWRPDVRSDRHRKGGALIDPAVFTKIASAQQIVRSAIAEFGRSLAVVTSFQREGVVILDLVLDAAPSTPVLTLDTGRLPEATDRMIASIEARYGLRVERILPDPDEVDSMVSLYGRDLFFESVAHRTLCCNIRKVRPLARRTRDFAGYYTGLRRSQGESRAAIEIFERSASPVKISPLAEWSAADVLAYTALNHLPEHPLYAAGYSSIGCDPCSRATAAGEDERAGRWWWEQDAQKECGLHFTPDGRTERTVDVLLRDVLRNAKAVA